MPEIDVQQAIEEIRCAYVNSENIKKLGLTGIKIVQMQLNEALKCLGEEPMEDVHV